MSRVVVIQHAPCETLGTISQVLGRRGISADCVRTFDGEPVPKETGSALGLILMGGPMSVHEQARYPFLLDEVRLIEQALTEEKPILGVCLGSQLLARTLGAPVTKGERKEIGWHRVWLTEAALADPLGAGVEPSFVAYHWHGDVFALPAGAVSLAFSQLTQCQALRYGRNAYGFLFHMEVTEKIIAEMIRIFSAELEEAGIDANELAGETERHLPSLERIGQAVFENWATLLT